MREKNVEKLDFLTKVYVEGNNGHAKARMVLKSVFATLLLLMLIVLSNGEFSPEVIGPYIIALIPIAIILILTKPDRGYKDVPVTVEFYTSKLVVIYDDINKGDKLGRIKEKISIKYTDINKLQYSNALSCLNIEGMPLHIIKPLNVPNGKEIISDFSEKGESKQTLLSVGEEHKERILNTLRINTGLAIMELD